MSVWEALDSGKPRDLTSQDKFMLFTPDAMLREGVKDETVPVFTPALNPLRQVFNADQTEPLTAATVVESGGSPSLRRSPADVTRGIIFYLKKQN